MPWLPNANKIKTQVGIGNEWPAILFGGALLILH